MISCIQFQQEHKKHSQKVEVKTMQTVMTKTMLERELSYAKVLNTETKAAKQILFDFDYAARQGITDVRDAYKSCSDVKKGSFDAIESRAYRQGATMVYIAGHSAMSYSTVYRISVCDDDGDIWLATIKDTKDNTYIVYTLA